jgi:hypothetical protein
VLETYASVIAVCASSLAIGHAALALCGWRRWSWLAPATGLALVTALCWGTVRLPGEGTVSAIAVLVLTVASLAFLRGRVGDAGEALRDGAPVALAALAAASLPFIVEGRFGILGTSFNPDMSQHLLAADRLAHGTDSQLLAQSYPLGPHAIVVALDKGMGVGLVQGFGGLTLAVSVLASLTALAALADLRPGARWVGALLVGLPYMVASYLAQGAFKESMQALFLLAFAICLWQLSPAGDRSGEDRPNTDGSREGRLRNAPGSGEGRRRGVTGRAVGWLATGRTPPPPPSSGSSATRRTPRPAPRSGSMATGQAPRPAPDAGSLATGRATSAAPSGVLVGVPLALLAAGSVFTYSFPGLTWLAGALGLWALAELFLVGRGGGDIATTLRGAAQPAWLALIVFAVLVAPELGRMIDFGDYETFDPHGPGLGNLFGQISPAEALGIWPSGDFRLTAGAGAVPAIGFYAGVAFAAVLLLWGLVWWLRRGEVALAAALAAAALAYAAARIGGTPYTAAKAVQMAAPLAALIIVRPLLAPVGRLLPRPPAEREVPPFAAAGRAAVAAAFVVAAGGCSLLALANGPVGPTGYSPALTSLRPQISSGSTLVLAPVPLLHEQHGTPFVAWELRGGRVCIEEAGPATNSPPPKGIAFVISWRAAGPRPPFAELRIARRAGPYLLWRRTGVVPGPSPCPLIAVRSARQGERQVAD